MGIQSVSTHSKPAPKATCPKCGRPVAVVKSGRCSYCGTWTGELLANPAPMSSLPPEVLLALEAPAGRSSRGAVWGRRLLSLGVLGIVMILFAGTCMRS